MDTIQYLNKVKGLTIIVNLLLFVISLYRTKVMFLLIVNIVIPWFFRRKRVLSGGKADESVP